MTTSSMTQAHTMQPFTPISKTVAGYVSSSATPIKSILKPASVLGNRKARHGSPDDMASEIPPDSPNKRRKVFFDDVKNVTYELKGRSMDDIKLEVRMALEEHLRGIDGQYDTLKEMFENDRLQGTSRYLLTEDEAPKSHELQAYMIALTSCVPLLRSKQCNGLVKTILKCSWLGRDDIFNRIYTHFLAALVSSQASYLPLVLGMLVEKFTFSRSMEWAVPGYPSVDRSIMRKRLHSAIRNLLQIFPSAKTVFENLLKNCFPFPDMSLRVHMAYIHNLLRAREYVPDLQEEILDLTLDRAVKIDSQMQLDLEDMDDDIATAVMYALSQKTRQTSEWEEAEDIDDESDAESVASDDEDFDSEGARIKTVKDSVEKMDAMLDTLFRYYTPLFADAASDVAFDAFTTILREFEQMVLPTYKSRHTQFLVFHFAQQDERLIDAFCGQLIAMAFQTNVPNILKQAAAAYLASFVARAARVSAPTVRDIFRLLIHHLGEYREKYEPICRGPDLKRFHSYYSLVQAVMYIFCFRWKDLVVASPEHVDADDAASYIGQELEWVGNTRRDLSIHVFGKLNPLKVCAPVIVEEFAKLAHRLNFLYVYPLIENNKRIRLTQFLSSTYATGGALRDVGYETQDEAYHQLDPYFPFDPYQLPVSKRWLEGDYVHWEGIPGLNADDGNDSLDDDDDDDDEDEDEEEDDVENELDRDGADFDEDTATNSDGDD